MLVLDIINLFYTPEDLTVEKYKNIFKYRSHLRYLPDISERYDTEVGMGYRFSHLLESCFKNSVWYYPGQLFPEVNLSISNSDYRNIKEGYNRNEYGYEMKNNKIEKIIHPYFGMVYNEDIIKISHNRYREIKLSDYVRTINTEKYSNYIF